MRSNKTTQSLKRLDKDDIFLDRYCSTMFSKRIQTIFTWHQSTNALDTGKRIQNGRWKHLTIKANK